MNSITFLIETNEKNNKTIHVDYTFNNYFFMKNFIKGQIIIWKKKF